MKRKALVSAFVSVFLVAVLIVPAHPVIAAPAPYFEGKTITIICGTGPGGGYDRASRLFAKFLPKYIPGKPTVIVENMEGGSSIIAANHVFNIAKPDGLTIGVINRGIPFAQLLKTEGVKFDLTKFAWLGSPTVETNLLALRADLPYKNVQDLRNAKGPIKLGSGGPASSATQFPLLLKAYAGIKNIQMVFYRSSREVSIAVEQKEVDGQCTGYTSFKSYIEKGIYRAFVRGRVSEPGIEKLPVDEDLTTDPIGKKIMALRSGPDRIGRPFVLPPKTPNEVMTILRTAFSKACKDPELLAAAEKLEMRIEYVPGNECLTILNELFSQPPNIVKEMGKYIKF